MRKFIVALFLVMVVSAGLQAVPWKPLKKVLPKSEIVHAGYCCYYDKIPPYGGSPKTVCETIQNSCYWECYIQRDGSDCVGPNHHCNGLSCDPDRSPPGEDQCQVNQDCVNKGIGSYCCAISNGNICRDCPCNQNTCGGGGGGGCDVSAPKNLYNSSSLS